MPIYAPIRTYNYIGSTVNDNQGTEELSRSDNNNVPDNVSQYDNVNERSGNHVIHNPNRNK